jgi:hypothetical protein
MKISMALLILMLVPVTALNAPLTNQGYIGLFVDESRSFWCADGEPPYTVELWIWCLPSDNGQSALEFGVSYPSNILFAANTLNESLWIGLMPIVECEGDVCALRGNYYECQWDWHWIFHQTLMVTDCNTG